MRRIVFAALLLSAALSHAAEFRAPETLSWNGKVYTLVYKRENLSDGRRLYEYTTNGESVDAWTTLLTFNYARGVVADPMEWLVATKNSLDRTTPRPHYKLSKEGQSGLASIIYEPTVREPTYESDVHRSYHVAACGGLVIYQVAVKYAPAGDVSPQAKFAELDRIATENGRMAETIKKSDWTPRCD